MVSVPGRQIHSILQSFFTASISQFAYHIALAILPRRVFYAIFCILRWPHTESAMMFGGEDNTLHASLLANASPLATVEVGRVEKLRVFVAKAPLLISVCIQRVMDKGIHLHVLPPQLVLSGYRTTGCVVLYLGMCQYGHHGHQYGDNKLVIIDHRSVLFVSTVSVCTKIPNADITSSFLCSLAHDALFDALEDNEKHGDDEE